MNDSYGTAEGLGGYPTRREKRRMTRTAAARGAGEDQREHAAARRRHAATISYLIVGLGETRLYEPADGPA